MAQVASGHVRDRPFVRTLYTIAARRFTGDLTLIEAGRSYALCWQGGLVVGAVSPAPADTVARMALADGLVTTTHVSETLRRLAGDKSQSQLDVLAQVARLRPEQVTSLRQRNFGRRAIRIFALNDASFALDDAPSAPPEPEIAPIDVRWLIFNGLLAHYDERRLHQELAVLGDRHFALREGVKPALGPFELDPDEAACVNFLDTPTTLSEFVARAGQLDRKRALALVYALVATEFLHAVAPSSTAAASAAPTSAAPTQQDAPARPGTSTSRPLAESPEPKAPAARIGDQPAARPHVQADQASILAASDGDPQPAAAQPDVGHSAPAARADAPRALGAVKKRAARGPRISPEQARKLVQDKIAELEGGASLFQLLGIEEASTDEELRLSYFSLARYLHPDRLRALGLDDLEAPAQRVFAEINRGFAILSDRAKRSRYLDTLAAGGERAVRAQQRQAEELAARLFGAEEAFQRGTMALRRNQFRDALDHFRRAVELNPDEGEHHALFAWSLWASHEDKASVAKEVRRAVRKAIGLQPKCVPAYFYRGKIAHTEGDVETARECFLKVLELEPQHQGAQTELRIMDSRKGKDKGGGLFRRKR